MISGNPFEACDSCGRNAYVPVSAKFRVSNLAYELGELASALVLACERAVAHTLVTRASNVAANLA